MIAEFIGLLIIVMAVWTQRVEPRKWMRVLGWIALAAVVGQGILGGITVLNFLPWSISTAHATLGQMIFCIVVAMALFTSRAWLQDCEPIAEPELTPSTPTLAALAAVCVWVQLILGAAFRHSGMKLLPHLIGACVVTAVLCWTVVRVLTRYGTVESPSQTGAASVGAADVPARSRLRRLSHAPHLWPQCNTAVADYGNQHGCARGLRRAGAGGERDSRYTITPHDSDPRRRSCCPYRSA